LKTRISIRPCPVRNSELLRQGGIHPVLARVYAARGLADARELASELQALLPPGACTASTPPPSTWPTRSRPARR
jgi:single-stranded-DNA-specific exonuclease